MHRSWRRNAHRHRRPPPLVANGQLPGYLYNQSCRFSQTAIPTVIERVLVAGRCGLPPEFAAYAPRPKTLIGSVSPTCADARTVVVDAASYHGIMAQCGVSWYSLPSRLSCDRSACILRLKAI